MSRGKEQTGITPAMLEAMLSGRSIYDGTPEGIEAAEAQGQKDFVGGNYLPKECPREALEKLGFVFGADKDDLFVYCQFPDGWYKQADDHSMWNGLYDPKGRRRGSIFYKAAFYDRSAHMHLDARYYYGRGYGVYPETRDYDSDNRYFAVFDKANNEAILFHTEPLDRHADWRKEDEYKALAKEWVTKNYPDYADVTAYWD